MLTVIPVTHRDVRGKELYYLKISNGLEDMVVNVGKTTHDNVAAMNPLAPIHGSFDIVNPNTTDNESSEVDNNENKTRRHGNR